MGLTGLWPLFECSWIIDGTKFCRLLILASSLSLCLTSVRTRSNKLTTSSTFSLVKHMGGFSLITLHSGPSALNSIFPSLILLITFPYTNLAVQKLIIYLCKTIWAHSLLAFLVSLSSTKSMPTNRPLPLTSPMYLCFLAKVWHWKSKYSPTTRAFSLKFSFSITSKTALAIAHETGLPPYCFDFKIKW